MECKSMHTHAHTFTPRAIQCIQDTFCHVVRRWQETKEEEETHTGMKMCTETNRIETGSKHTLSVVRCDSIFSNTPLFHKPTVLQRNVIKISSNIAKLNRSN